MSSSSMESVTCPECGASSEFQVWPSVNVTLDPKLGEALRDGSLVTFTCACGASSRVQYDLLYHDMERRLMIQVTAGDIEEARTGLLTALDSVGELSGLGADTYTTRLVRDRNELMDKVNIDHSGLDDRVVEVLKLVAAANISELAGRRVYFEGADEKEVGLIAFDDQGESAHLALPRDAYDGLETLLRGAHLLDDEPPWSVVDEGRALWLLEHLPKPSADGAVQE